MQLRVIHRTPSFLEVLRLSTDYNSVSRSRRQCNHSSRLLISNVKFDMFSIRFFSKCFQLPDWSSRKPFLGLTLSSGLFIQIEYNRIIIFFLAVNIVNDVVNTRIDLWQTIYLSIAECDRTSTKPSDFIPSPKICSFQGNRMHCLWQLAKRLSAVKTLKQS